MPDIFDLNAMRHLTLENDMARVKEGSSPLEEARQKTLAADMGRVKEMREPWEGLREKYGFDLSPEEYTRFGMYMDHGMLKEDDLVKIVTARAISQGLGRMGIEVPESNVYQNLEAYKTSILGKSILGDNEAPRTPIGDLDAIARSLKNGFITLDNGRLGIERAIAMGQKDKEVLRAIEERIRVNNEKAARNTDFQKRNIFTTIGKATAEMLPYSLATVAAGLGGWPIGIAGSFLVSGGVAAGNVFNTLIDDINADYEPALGISIGVGAVIGIAESLFGEAASLLSEITGAKTVIKSFSRSAAKAAADRVGSRVGKAAVNRLAPFAGALAMETLMNGAEEFVEEWASIGAEELAYQLSENGVKPGRDYLNRSIQAFKGGMLGSIFLSAPGAWGSANATVKNIKALKTAAEAAESFKEFEELSKENPYYKDLSSKEKEEVYSKARQKREMEEKALVERNRKEKPAASPEPVEAAPREARRKEGGSLHYKTRAVDIADNGTVSSVMTVGDPQSGNRYGQIDYRLNENELVIDRVNFASWLTDKEEVIHDALIELAAENKQAGNIVWNTENAIEMDIRDRVIKENPFGNSLQWFDPDMDAGEVKTDLEALVEQKLKGRNKGPKARTVGKICNRPTD